MHFCFQITGQCFVYEPHFSLDDKNLVEEFGCSLIEHNEVGYQGSYSLKLLKFHDFP